MIIHLKYLSYVVRHKWFVLVSGIKVGAPLWRLLIHDWTKLLPGEWFPYARFFYGSFPSIQDVHGDARLHYTGRYKETVAAEFDAAWNRHQKANPHHWQYWLLTNDSGKAGDPGKTVALEMPERFAREMVADWMGAGRAILGSKSDTYDWYLKNQDNIQLHPATRTRVWELLKEHCYWGDKMFDAPSFDSPRA